MSGSLLSKVGIASLAAGGVGIVGWRISSNKPNQETVNSYLLSRGRDLPTTSQEWEKLKDFYSKEESVNLISEVPKENVTKEKIQGWCLQESKKPFKEHSRDKLRVIETWCSKARTLSEQIILLKKEKLDTDTAKDSNPDKETWNQNEKDYKVAGHGFKIKKKDSSNWIDLPESEGTSDLMKTWCKEHSEKQFKYQEDSLFITWQKWCSKDK